MTPILTTQQATRLRKIKEAVAKVNAERYTAIRRRIEQIKDDKGSEE